MYNRYSRQLANISQATPVPDTFFETNIYRHSASLSVQRCSGISMDNQIVELLTPNATVAWSMEIWGGLPAIAIARRWAGNISRNYFGMSSFNSWGFRITNIQEPTVSVENELPVFSGSFSFDFQQLNVSPYTWNTLFTESVALPGTPVQEIDTVEWIRINDPPPYCKVIPITSDYALLIYGQSGGTVTVDYGGTQGYPLFEYSATNAMSVTPLYYNFSKTITLSYSA